MTQPELENRPAQQQQRLVDEFDEPRPVTSDKLAVIARCFLLALILSQSGSWMRTVVVFMIVCGMWM